jgi:hypothetical protein
MGFWEDGNELWRSVKMSNPSVSRATLLSREGIYSTAWCNIRVIVSLVGFMQTTYLQVLKLIYVYIVTWRLKAGMVESEKTAC